MVGGERDESAEGEIAPMLQEEAKKRQGGSGKFHGSVSIGTEPEAAERSREIAAKASLRSTDLNETGEVREIAAKAPREPIGSRGGEPVQVGGKPLTTNSTEGVSSKGRATEIAAKTESVPLRVNSPQLAVRGVRYVPPFLRCLECAGAWKPQRRGGRLIPEYWRCPRGCNG